MSNNQLLRTVCLRCSSLAAMSSGKMPAYNQGLTGKGKVKRFVPGQQVSYRPQVAGEILFGIHPVLLALQSRKRKIFNKLFIRTNKGDDRPMSENMEKIFHLASEQHVEVNEVRTYVLDSLSGARPHQGVCLDASRFPVKRLNMKHHTESVAWDQPLLWLYLHNVQGSDSSICGAQRLLAWIPWNQEGTKAILGHIRDTMANDPMNMGAILRTSHFLGVDQVVLPSFNSCNMTPVVSKASSGTMEVMNPLSLSHDSDSVVKFLQTWKGEGGVVVGTATEDQYSHQVHRYTISQPTLLIVGNEGFGIDKSILKLCDILLSIQPQGVDKENLVGSLNVSVATGIILHSLLSSRRKS